MKVSIGFAVALLAGSGAFAAGASAPAKAAPATPVKVTYEMTAGGQALGTENAALVTTEAGSVLTGEVRLKTPKGEGTLAQEANFAMDGTLVAYRLDVDIPGQQLTIKATPSANGYTAVVLPKGGTEPLETRSIAAKPPVVLLDNNFASHIDLLTRRLVDLGPDSERSYTFLVPQVVQAIPGTVKRLGDGTGTFEGKPVATRSYRVTIANVAEELTARAADGALLRVEVPMQQLVITRAGFAPAEAAKTAKATPGDDTREKDVVVSGPAGELPATLLLPASRAPVAGVVFLSGAGPNDKDETIGPNKPFRDIARALGNRGIASLRFDKRTHALKDKAQTTLAAEYFEDAAAALKMLAATPGVDPKRVFLLGHSEGAMVAPRIAQDAGGVHGLVLMAPGVRPLDAMIIDQMAYGAKLMGRTDEEIADQTKLMKEKFDAIRDLKRIDPPSVMGAPASYWREVLALDVTRSVKEAKIPVLVLQGDKDVQVRKDLDFDVLAKAVGTDGGRVTYRNFPDLNHLFMKVEGQSSGAEYGIPGEVAPAVASAIADWILAH
jgi:alpha-beta hydrolase superfamily lysophospholipase